MIERTSLGMIAAPTRRRLLIGFGASLIAALAAPSIVRAASLMDLRGVPMRPALEYLPCDGIELREMDYPSLFQSFGRRYGGNLELKTFAVPDFNALTPLLDLGGKLNYEVNRDGELFASLIAPKETHDEIRRKMLSFSEQDQDALLRGDRIKM